MMLGFTTVLTRNTWSNQLPAVFIFYYFSSWMTFSPWLLVGRCLLTTRPLNLASCVKTIIRSNQKECIREAIQKWRGGVSFIFDTPYKYIYSSGNKFVIFCFAQLLPQILDNFQKQGQLWNLLVLTISIHPLHVQFDQVLAEIFEVKDKWSHS